MPYGVDKSIGGDNPSNDKWMEHCVSSVMSKNKKMPKDRAIMICKSQLKKSRGDKAKASLFVDFVLEQIAAKEKAHL